jgi:hypothetical protein
LNDYEQNKLNAFDTADADDEDQDGQDEVQASVSQ